MSNESQRAGWGIKPWVQEIGKSRAWYYGLPPALQPFCVKVGASRIITESPRDYLQRVGKQVGPAPNRRPDLPAG